MKSQHADQDKLRAALEAVARSTSGERAPDSVEQTLLLEFRRLSNSREPRAPRSARILAVAAVLAVAATATLLWMISGNPGAVEAPAASPYSFELSAPPAQHPMAFAEKKPRLRETPSREVVTAFLPLGYSSPATEAYQVVRVQLDRSSLLQFGLPVNVELADRPVDADLLIGSDGMPRAVRFVNRISSTSETTMQNWRNP
jgi:hypothetical protein